MPPSFRRLLPALLPLSLLSCAKMDEGLHRFSEVDGAFMMQAAANNLAGADAGATAAARAATDAVQRFGGDVAAAHTGAQNELVALGRDVGKTNLPVAPDSTYTARKQALLQHSGRAFDSAYLPLQAAAHADAIRLMEAEIRDGVDPRIVGYARTQLPVLQDHKRIADSLIAASGF